MMIKNHKKGKQWLRHVSRFACYWLVEKKKISILVTQYPYRSARIS